MSLRDYLPTSLDGPVTSERVVRAARWRARRLARDARRARGRLTSRPAALTDDQQVALQALPALTELGWVRSRRGQLPVDADGEPLPWYTYPAIHFLALRLPPTARVLEYGSGQSTRWWAARSARVTAVEHDAEWVARIRQDLPANVKLLDVPLDEDGRYARVAEWSGEGPFDVVVVDGRDRANCIRRSVPHLSRSGVLVLDNANRSKYRDVRRWLRRQGFRELPFRGFAPRGTRLWDTSVFYREGNCLKL